MLRRIICAAVIQNSEGEYLLCKAHPEYGVFPNQWAFPGGGMEDYETLEEAVRREVREEVGLELESFQPLEFADDFRVKKLRDGTTADVYMIYLLFSAVAKDPENIQLNDEFVEYKWVRAEKVLNYDLNEPARQTFHIIFHGR
jgi:nucleoside triphosphatase